MARGKFFSRTRPMRNIAMRNVWKNTNKCTILVKQSTRPNAFIKKQKKKTKYWETEKDIKHRAMWKLKAMPSHKNNIAAEYYYISCIFPNTLFCEPPCVAPRRSRSVVVVVTGAGISGMQAPKYISTTINVSFGIACTTSSVDTHFLFSHLRHTPLNLQSFHYCILYVYGRRRSSTGYLLQFWRTPHFHFAFFFWLEFPFRFINNI